MISIQKGEDLITITLQNILSYRKDDEDFIKLVLNWNKKVLIEVDGFYPVEVIFDRNEIKFKTKDFDKKINLKVKMDIYTFLDLAFGRLNPVKAFLKGKLKIKGLLKIGTVLKFMKIFLKTMKMVASDPNNNYFELNKETR
jgi:putative sterol carrier protein